MAVVARVFLVVVVARVFLVVVVVWAVTDDPRASSQVTSMWPICRVLLWIVVEPPIFQFLLIPACP